MAFKVIICGAGPVGLTAAHALSEAGIDYVVLERRDEVVIDIGATIVVYQGTLRIMSQLGLLDRLRNTGCPIQWTALRSVVGDVTYCDLPLSDHKEHFGEDGFIMHRADLLSALYDSFSATEKAKILTGKKVSDISSDENGVKVQCADGTSYEGSIAIGADGVHSAARRAIRSLALKAGKPDVDGENPFTTQFRMLWLSAPRPARVRAARSAQSFNKTASVQMLLGKEKCWIFLYERLDTPAAKSDRVTYTEQDMFDYIEKWGHLTCEDDLTVRDVFATRYKAGLINLEEGVVNQWHQGRICLVGDAAHKFTPNAGLGFNNGAQDVAVALNEILRVVKADPNPTVPALSAAFDKYQSIRMEPLVKDYKASAVTTRYQTYETFLYWFIDRCLMRYLGFMQRGLLNLGVVDRVRIARPLEFLPGTEPFQGKTPWDFPMSQTIDLKR